MKRAPIVLAGTAIGLVGLVSYHTSATGSVGLTGALAGTSSVSSSSSSSATQVASRSTTTGKSSGTPASTSAGKSSSNSGSSQTKSTSPSTVSPAVTRSAVGRTIQYGYGELAVKVTMNGSTITNVSMATARVADGQSGTIDQYVLPLLRKQALSAQGARIQGISGASYTSQAYAQSLQSAIDKLTTAQA